MASNFTIPKEITIENESYPLEHLSQVTHSTHSPYLMIDGKPVISIEHYCGVAKDEPVRRAIIAIDSFKANNGKYCVIPDMTESLNHDFQRPFTEDMIDLKMSSMDMFEQFGVNHFVVESKRHDDYYRYAIFDRELIVKILTKLQHNNAFYADKLSRY